MKGGFYALFDLWPDFCLPAVIPVLALEIISKLFTTPHIAILCICKFGIFFLYTIIGQMVFPRFALRVIFGDTESNVTFFVAPDG